MSKRKGLREIPWGINDNCDEMCIYDNGHIQPEKFIAMVKAMKNSDVPEEARAALTVKDVEYARFRPMSPYEARDWGGDWGVMESEDGEYGYPVTRVVL